VYIHLAAEVPRNEMQRAAAMSTPLRAAGHPREKGYERTQPHDDQKKPERALKHRLTVLPVQVATSVGDADLPDGLGPRGLESQASVDREHRRVGVRIPGADEPSLWPIT
jgi:hypothetical protein